jgi:O-antigen/teichoic acid export membrane protein
MNQNKEYSVFGRQVGIIIASNVFLVVLGIIQVPIITKNLGTSLYGSWSLINTMIVLIVPFTTLSFGTSIIRFLAAEKDQTKIKDDFYSACALVTITGIVLSLLLFLLSGFIGNYFFKDNSLEVYIKLSSILILLNSIFPVFQAFFRRGTQIGIYTFLNLGLNILQCGLIVVFVTLGYKITGVIIAFIISALVMNLVALFIIFKQIGFQRPRFKNIKTYLKWGIPLTPNNAIQWIVSQSDRYVINYFFGLAATGIYSAAYSVGIYASFALYPIGIVLYPVISKKYDEGNFEECAKYLEYSFKYLMMISIPAAVGLSVLSKPLLTILTTPEFIPGSNVVPFITLSGIMFCVFQISIYVIHLVKKTHLTIRLLGSSAILNVVLNILLVPRMGIIGAGLASCLAYGFLGIMTIVVTRKYLKFNLSFRFIVKSLISSGMMALIIWLIRPESLLMVLISIIIGVIIYCGVLVSIKGFTRGEISFFTSFITSRFHNKHTNANN